MWIAFQLTKRESNPMVDSLLIRGGSWNLARLFGGSGGPYYPCVEEQETPEHYRFFAGQLVEEKGEDVFAAHNEPDGSFLALEFDKRSDRVRLRSDLFNSQRWYYLDAGDSYYFSNSLRHLFRVSDSKPDIEQRAVPYMLRMGYVPEPFTPLKNVYSLPCGEVLTVESGKLTRKKRAVLPVSRRPPKEQFSNPQALAELLVDEVRRYVRGVEHLYLPLSGGIDSRVLLGCALRSLAPEQISTFTFGAEDSLDVKIGLQIARHCGVKHAVLPPDPRPMNQLLDDNFAVAEGVYWSVPDYPVKSFREAMTEKSIALSGFIGDPVFGSKEGKFSAADSTEGREDELVACFWKEATYVNPDHIHPLLDIHERDPLGLLDIYREVSGGTMMERYDHWYFGQHTVNRTMFAISPARDRTFYLMPFVAKRVLDAAFALPSNLRAGQRAYFAALKHGFPDLYAIPTTRNHGFPLSAGQSLQVALTRFGRRLGREIDERIGAKFGWHLYHNPRLNYMHPREPLRTKHRDSVIAGIERASELTVFRKDNLQAVRESVAKGKGVDAVLLRGLLTIGQWSKEYNEA